MFDIGAFIIIGIGLFMLMNPDGYYELMESWKNNSSDQPSYQDEQHYKYRKTSWGAKYRCRLCI